MDSRKGAARPSTIADHPAQHLVCGADEFSIKVSSAVDERFWVRIEKERDQGALVVTDFTPGDRPLAELEAGILLALRASGGFARTLIFRNLIPSGDQCAGFPVKVLQTADVVKQLGAAVEKDFSRSVMSFELRPRRGKIDAVITFAGLDVVPA